MRPRLLNLTCPPGRDVYELQLLVKSKVGVLHRITGFLAEANVDILSMHIQAERERSADIIAFLEMSESNASMDELLKAVRRLDFVQEANAVRKNRQLFEEFLFPIMIESDLRGFLMSESAWMSITSRLVSTYGTGGLAILYEAGVACGEEYAKQLQTKLGLKASPETMIENLKVMLRSRGLGTIEMSQTHEGFLVKVNDPIVPATETKIHDHFLTGVIAGATGRLFATSYSVDKVRFEGNELSFTLGRRPSTAKKDARVARAEAH